jgi:hypothetical protein
VVSFTLQPIYFQGKSPWYPLVRRLGGPQSRSGRSGEEKNIFAPTGNLTKLSWFVTPCCDVVRDLED